MRAKLCAQACQAEVSVAVTACGCSDGIEGIIALRFDIIFQVFQMVRKVVVAGRVLPVIAIIHVRSIVPAPVVPIVADSITDTFRADPCGKRPQEQEERRR